MATLDVFGADLRVGQVLVVRMPDGTEDPHTIDHFREYPGRFVGDHARRAYYDEAETCGCTVADHEKFHVQTAEVTP